MRRSPRCAGSCACVRRSPDEELLAFAKEVFAHYVQYGMTANYANYNWFGRPYWTEPCAIVDSYMASMALFRLTQQSEYAVLANRIYYNALLASQRPNGGFGCDLCSGTEQSGRFVQANTDVYEAWWCCSMRGAEGLCSAAANSILTEDGQIWFVHYLPGHFHTEQADIDVKTNYPHENRVQLSLRGIRRELQLHLYIPQGTKDVSVQINGQPQRVQLSDFLRISVCEDAELELSFSLSPRSVPAGGFFTAKRAQMTMQGDQILSKDADRKLGFLADRIYTERDQQCRAEILDSAISIQKAIRIHLNRISWAPAKAGAMCVLNTVDMRFLEKRQSVKKRLFSYFV